MDSACVKVPEVELSCSEDLAMSVSPNLQHLLNLPGNTDFPDLYRKYCNDMESGDLQSLILRAIRDHNTDVLQCLLTETDWKATGLVDDVLPACLVYAIYKDKCDMVELLLTHGASCSVEISSRILVSLHPNYNVLERHLYTPVELAIALDKPHIVQSLLASSQTDTFGALSCTPLHLAVHHHSDKCLEHFLATDSAKLVNVHDRMELTPFLLAATWPEALKKLLSCGGDVNTLSLGSNENILQMFTAYRHGRWQAEDIDVVKALVEAGTNVDTQLEEKCTPLGNVCDAILIEVDQTILSETNSWFGKDQDGNSVDRTLDTLMERTSVIREVLVYLATASASSTLNATLINLAEYFGDHEILNLDFGKIPKALAIDFIQVFVPKLSVIVDLVHKIMSVLIMNGGDFNTKSDEGGSFLDTMLQSYLSVRKDCNDVGVPWHSFQCIFDKTIKMVTDFVLMGAEYMETDSMVALVEYDIVNHLSFLDSYLAVISPQKQRIYLSNILETDFEPQQMVAKLAFENCLSNVHSLKSESRRAVLAAVKGLTYTEKVEQLPLPANLKDYIKNPHQSI